MCANIKGSRYLLTEALGLFLLIQCSAQGTGSPAHGLNITMDHVPHPNQSVSVVVTLCPKNHGNVPLL